MIKPMTLIRIIPTCITEMLIFLAGKVPLPLTLSKACYVVEKKGMPS